MVAREYREIETAAIVDIANGAFRNHAGHAANFGAESKISAPACGIDARALLDDNDVARFCGFDGGGAEVAGVGASFGAIELYGQDAARDAAVGREAR